MNMTWFYGRDDIEYYIGEVKNDERHGKGI